MTPGRDEDALSWEGDDDPTLEVGPRPDVVTPEPEPEPEQEPAASGETLVLPEGFTAVGRGSDSVATPSQAHEPRRDQTTQPAEPTRLSNPTLVALGIIGGVFLLYTIGWIVGGLRLQGTAQFLVSPVIYQVAFWLAVVAPLAWFAAVYLLTRASKAWVRLAWLIGGVALLIPWPFIMTGAVGQ